MLPAWLTFKSIDNDKALLFGKPPNSYSSGDLLKIKITTTVTKNGLKINTVESVIPIKITPGYAIIKKL